MNWRHLIYLIISGLISCTSSVEKIEHTPPIISATQGSYQHIDTVSHFEVDLKFPVIDGERAPEIITSINNVILDKFHQFVDQKSFVAAHEELPSDFGNHEKDWRGLLTNSYSVNQADSFLFISFSIYQYYLGAAHGFSTNKSLMFDLSTGKELAASNFFKLDTPSLHVIQNQFNRNLPDSICWGLQADSSILPAISDFYFIPDTLVFTIDDYELCPFAFGHPEIKICTDSLSSVLIHSEFTHYFEVNPVVDEGEIATH